jgi:hypothetical protein
LVRNNDNFTEASPEIISKCISRGYIQSQGGTVPFIGELMREAILGGEVKRNLEMLKKEYMRRVKVRETKKKEVHMYKINC